MKKILISGLLALSLPAMAIAEEQSAIAFTAGGYDAFDNEDNAVELGLEYRFAPATELYSLIPTVGAAVTSDGAYWAYAGVRYDWSLSTHWVLTPHFALAAYENGGGVDLGYGIEFRTGLDIGYQLNDKSRLSLGYYHMSNADLGEDNPGADSIIVSYSYSLDQ